MKTILILCGLILVAGGALLYRHLKAPSHFGPPFEGAPMAEAADLLARPKDFTKKTVAVEGVVTKQCTTMGCFFFFPAGDKLLRVDLAEVAMNAPWKQGHRARVEGRMVPYDGAHQFWAVAVEFY